jgi:hypothetical protein
MRKIGLLVAFLGVCLFSTANAGLTVTCDDDGDGVIQMGSYSVTNGDYENGIPVYDLSIACVQTVGDYGHLLGDFTVDGDPIVWILEEVDNQTDFAWTDYHIAIGMSQIFSITDYQAPTGWTAVITAPIAGQLLPNGSTGYLGFVDFYGGPAIQIGEVGNFGVKTQFDGSVNFCTEQWPTPEPTTLAMLGLGALSLLRRKK